MRSEPKAGLRGGRAQQTIHPFPDRYKAVGASGRVYAFGVPSVAHDVDGVMQEVTVLVLVRDILGAGLFGALADSLGRTPVFPISGERAESAVERLRPSVILLECHHPAARSEAFYAAAAGVAARVIHFAPGPPWDDCEAIARRHGVASFVHGDDGGSLADLVRQALSE